MAWFVFSQHCFKSVPLVRAASSAAADLKHLQIVAGFYGEPLNASPRTELQPTRSTVSERTGADDVTATRVSSNRVIQLTARSIRPTWSDGPKQALSEDATWVDWSQLPSCPNQMSFSVERNRSVALALTIPRIPWKTTHFVVHCFFSLWKTSEAWKCADVKCPLGGKTGISDFPLLSNTWLNVYRFPEMLQRPGICDIFSAR